VRSYTERRTCNQSNSHHRHTASGRNMPNAVFPTHARTSPEGEQRCRRNLGAVLQPPFSYCPRGILLPNIKSAKKWVRASKTRRERNQSVRTALKTAFKSAVAPGASAQLVRTAVSAHDKAAARGVIHRNKANRKKSRLAKQLAKKG
jgi:small subunit ribosomal protein S20